MAHGNYTRNIASELVSATASAPVTSAEQVWDYNMLDGGNNPRTQEDINADVASTLSGIDPNAEENQNAFSNVKVGSTTIAADSKTDTLELVAGNNITLTADATSDKVTISASGGANQNAFSNIIVGSEMVEADAPEDTFEIAGSGGVSVGADNDTITIGLDLSAAITGLSASTAAAARNDYIVAQYAGGNDADPVNNTYVRRSLANLFKAMNSTDINTALGYVPYSQTSANNLAARIQTLEDTAVVKDSSGNVAITTGNVTLGKAGATIQLAGSSVKWGNSELATQYWVNNQGFAMNSVATPSANGLMSSDDKTKLNGIAAGAEVNQNAFSRISGISHGTFLNDVNAETKTDEFTFIAGDNITLENTYGKGIKINASGGGGSQNTFSKVKVGNTTIEADSTADTLELVAGNNVTLTADATNDKVTIAATGGGGGGGVTSVAMTVPAGLSISGSPITSTGTLALSTDPGYVIPLAADIEKGITAWRWGNHALAGYLTGNLKSTTKATYDSNTISNTQYRQYAVTPDKSGYLSVNVPWEAYSNATTSAAGLMSSSDKTKLNGIASGAEVNQNAFSNVKVGSTTIQADSKTDTLELVAGENITLTADSTNDKITITATGGGGGGGISSVKSLNTDNSESQSPANETISGTGTINLHKTSKTGKYDDLVMDREAATGSMGRILLQKASGTADYTAINNQMSGNSNTVFIVRDRFDIGTGTVTVPAGCVLKFEGGSIISSNSNGGTITGDNTAIDAELTQIFNTNVKILGTWNVAEAYPEWFGAVGDGETNDTDAIQAAVDSFEYVKLTNTYRISTVTVPQFHTVENSTTYVLDGDGYKMQMKSVLKGGVIEVSSSSRYFVDTVNHVLVTSNSVTAKTESITTSNTMTVGTTQYYYKEITVASGNIVRLSDDDISGYLFAYEDGAWVAQAWRTITSDSSSFKVRLARLKTAGSGYVYYDLITNKTQIQGDFRDYNTFIKYVPSAITIAEEPSNSRRVIIENIKITKGDIYDGNRNRVAGGAKDSYICAGIKTESDIIDTKWNSFFMFTDVDIYGLFYGIVGNLRACRFDVALEQCYNNIDLYGGLNIFNLLGQTGVMLNLGTQSNPVFPYEYFIYLEGSGNIINDGIYDIGSKVRNHRYLIKAKNKNVINSNLNTNYSNILANQTNGDYRSDFNYTWLGSHKHDYRQDGIQYTVTLTNGTYVRGGTTTSDVSSLDLLNPSSYIDFTPTGNYNSSTGTYSNTMAMTFFFEKVKNPFGVTAFAQSNGYNFQNMEIYYSKTTNLVGKTVLVNGYSRVITSSSEISVNSTITVNPGTTSEATYTVDGYNVVFNAGNLYVYSLVANVKQGGYPTLDWNADYYQYRDFNQENMRVVLTGNKVVRWFGMCIYTKTNQNIISGSTANRPVQELYVGQSYFDTDIVPKRPVYWDGLQWSDPIDSFVDEKESISYLQPPSGQSYTAKYLSSQNVEVDCYPDGKFVISGTAQSGGGNGNKLSNLFTLTPGTYILNREIVSGSVDGMMIFLMKSNMVDNVTQFNASTKTITIDSDTSCYIGINFESSRSYSCTINLSVVNTTPVSMQETIRSISARLDHGGSMMIVGELNASANKVTSFTAGGPLASYSEYLNHNTLTFSNATAVTNLTTVIYNGSEYGTGYIHRGYAFVVTTAGTIEGTSLAVGDLAFFYNDYVNTTMNSSFKWRKL